MFRTSRLVFIKFLGIWGAAQNSSLAQQKETDKQVKYKSNDEHNKGNNSKESTRLAIEASQKRILDMMLEQGIPGLTISVAKQGNTLWEAAFGFCDVENQVPCEPDAKMRIASISKSLFAATVIAPLIEENILKIDSVVHDFLSLGEFPKPKHKNKEYDLTMKQLLSHTSGVRHYDDSRPDDSTEKTIGSKESKRIHQTDDQYNRLEFYQRGTFRSVLDALEPFKYDELKEEPGKFHYTTYGYTLASAMAEKALQRKEGFENKQIEDYWIQSLRREWGMKNTFLDQDEVILPKRARYYLRTGLNGTLINAPYSDISNKWAGGGIISNTSDLIKFGNHLVDSYKGRDSSKLKRESVEMLWKRTTTSYGLGFFVRKYEDQGNKLVAYHPGGGLGVSTILVINPESEIVVVILTNLGFNHSNVRELGLYIAEKFA